jgi:hypothetical protein
MSSSTSAPSSVTGTARGNSYRSSSVYSRTSTVYVPFGCGAKANAPPGASSIAKTGSSGYLYSERGSQYSRTSAPSAAAGTPSSSKAVIVPEIVQPVASASTACAGAAANAPLSSASARTAGPVSRRVDRRRFML